MHIALARDMNVVNNRAAKDAALERNRQSHERILSVSRWPNRSGGSHILAYHHAPEEVEANSLVGTPDEIIGRLESLHRAGVECVIMNCGGSRESLRRFAQEIMPIFSDEPAKFRTVPA
jgi:alkanesulfonate monooxygenase SsuD/methylene tetrahydromethanopterin reductase-like flavin-dependent oxidoreductase (luciferase family)